MRKITQQAVNAFNENRNFKSGNTEVKVQYPAATYLYLHGNLIAKKVDRAISVSIAGWNTPTTRERLNGLGICSIQQKKGQLMLNGNRWDGGFTLVKEW